MTVWIAQYLCGRQRHAILAAAGEADDGADAEAKVATPLRDQVAELLGGKLLNPWCGLCGTTRDEWIVELQPTRFATLDEALPALRRTEAEQIATNAAFGDLHRTQRRN